MYGSQWRGKVNFVVDYLAVGKNACSVDIASLTLLPSGEDRSVIKG